jgi:hypothetical protein
VVGEWILAVRLTRRMRLSQLPSHDVQEAGCAHRWTSLGLTVGGGLLASLGGIVVLGIAVLLATGHPDVGLPADLAAGGMLVGVTPVLVGVALFGWGMHHLNEGGRATRRQARAR